MYKWAVVALLWLVCFFNYADRQAIYSVFPLLKTEMGLTDVQLGVVGASFMWVYAAAAPLAGIAGDRFARKTIVVSGLIFWSLVTVATAAFHAVLAPGRLPRARGARRGVLLSGVDVDAERLSWRRHALARDVDPPVERLRRAPSRAAPRRE